MGAETHLRRRVDWGMELALPLVTVAVAVALARAFRTWSPLWPLVVVGLGAHLVAFAGRMLRWSAVVATAVALGVGALVIGYVYYRGVGTLGLPGPRVWAAASHDIRVAFAPFQKLVAPVDARRGFTVSFAVGLWLMATFADLAAMRSDAPVQAVVAPVVTFVFSSVLLLGRYAALATALFVGSLVVLRLAVRASGVRARSLENGTVEPIVGSGVIWAAGVPALTLVLLSSLVLTTAAPAPDGGLVDLRSIGRGPRSRVVESPLVRIDSFLGDQSDQVLFTVESDQPHYWRLTALDDFDGREWSASARYRDLDDDERLPTPWPKGLPTRTERFAVEFRNFASNWLPTLLAPTTVTADIDLRYDAESSSVFVADDDSTASVAYDVVSTVAEPDPDTLRAARAATGRRLDPYLALPRNFPDSIRKEALRLTTQLSPYDGAKALQDYFLDGSHFRYDAGADYSDSTDPLQDFLTKGNGFCQQFATAYAAMARAAGIPARVAVGFTYGEPTTSTDSESGRPVTTWTIRGRYAHAWPEVYLATVGWVAFDPTPGRGNPDAQDYTDVAPAQDDGAGGSIRLGETTTTTTTVPAGLTPGGPSTTLPEFGRNATTAGSATTNGDSAATVPLVVLGVAAALLVLTALLVAVRLAIVRRRRARARGRDLSPGDRVAESWRQTQRDLARVQVRARPSETPVEFAVRAARTVEVQHLARLGRRESDRRFRSRPPDETEAQEAQDISDEVREVVWSRLDRRQRLFADLDLRPRAGDRR